MWYLVLLGTACQTAPETPVVLIEPAAPTTVDALVATPSPPPGEQWSWRWRRDGELQPELISAVVPAARTSKGERWSVEVVRHDERQQSAPAVAETTIANSPPDVTVRVTPDPPVPGAPLEALVQATDLDDDALDVEITWSRDGEPVSLGPVLAGDLVESLRNYEVAVRVSDGEADAATTARTLTGNEPPVVLEAHITPEAPTKASVLTVEAVVDDADGHDPVVQIEWAVDGRPAKLGATLDGEHFERGDSVKARVWPSDGYEEGLPYETEAVTVGNTPPLAAGALIVPGLLTELSVASCALVGGVDLDGDAVTADFRWLVDGTVAKLGPTLGSESFDRGQTVACEATPTDGIDVGAAVSSPAVVVRNTPPVVLRVAPVPAAPRSSDRVVADFDAADVDGDTVAVRVDWYADGVWIHQGPELPAGSVQRDQLLSLQATPDDGLDTGATVASVPVPVQNGLPVLSGAEISPDPLRTDDLGACVGVGAADPDGDPIGLTVTWLVDGIEVSDDVELDGRHAFDKRQQVQCVLTPHDGLEAGLQVASSPVRVSDTPPVAPQVALFPPDPHADEWLRCDRVADAYDADDDPITYEVAWTVDGRRWPSDSDTIPAGELGFGETWACTLHARTVDATVPSVPAARTTPAAPGGNVLLVLLDDVGVDKFAAYGAHPEQPQLPVIDSLAARGVRFTRAWAHPICSPTRAAILTGRHAGRTGVGATVDTEENRYDLPQTEVLLPEVLRLSPGRWTSALLGKWHLTYDDTPSWPDQVFAQGFDHFAGTRSNLNMPPILNDGEPGPFGYDWYELFDGSDLSMETTYATTRTVDDAVALLPTLSEPWFAFLSLHAPHRPLGVAPDTLVNSWPVTSSSPEWQRYNAALEAADTELGRLLASLDPAVLDATTIVVMGDNGTPEQAIRAPFDPLRSKMTLYEGGIRVPLIVAGPVVGQPGSTSDALVHARDLFPTIAHIAGERVGTLPGPIDGVTLLPWLADPDAPARRDFVYTDRFAPNGDHAMDDVRGEQAVHDGRFKVVRGSSGDWRLFELVDGAPDEGPDLLQNTLSPEQDAAFQRLSAALTETHDAIAYEH